MSTTTSHADQMSLVNHASILIKSEGVGLLSDPWYKGKAFDSGWSLLFENKHQDILDVLSLTTHIYLSHEHPDHLSIDFFKEHSHALKEKNIQILFQETKDGRVVSFLRDRCGLYVRECRSNSWFPLGDSAKAMVVSCGAIDSALVLETNQHTYVNLNDCDFGDVDLFLLEKRLHPAKTRIVFNQFSYAAWRGSLKWLKKAARFKLNHFVKSSMRLRADLNIPFASFIYFCAEDNFSLNKGANLPRASSQALEDQGCKSAFLPPWPAVFVSKELVENEQLRKVANASGVAFWQPHYERVNPTVFEEKAPVQKIPQDSLNTFADRSRKMNSILLMRAIRFLTLGRIFGSTTVFVKEPSQAYCLSFEKVVECDTPEALCDISTTLGRFLLILNTPYGFDTLSVSGRFQEKRRGGFDRLVFALGYLTLNSAGVGIRLKDLFTWKIFYRVINIPIRLALKSS